jgi:Zn2+/Cd2+-exporting ATPase
MSACCDPNPKDPESSWRIGAASTLVCGASILAGWALEASGFPLLGLAGFIAAYGAGGWSASVRTFAAIRKAEVDVDLLMLIAAAGAATVGHWIEGAALLFLFSLGTSLETYAFGRTRRSIQALMELRPETATLVRTGDAISVALDSLVPDDLVRVRPGERIPVDGNVEDGSSRIDESTLTGEPMPVSKGPGSAVFAGTLNGTGSLDIRVTRTADDSALSRVIQMVEDARETKAPTQSWIEAVEGRYAVGVILAAVVAVLVPWLLLGWSFDAAFYRAMTLLVVASPCALVISIPATIVSAVSNGARHGVLFKGGAHLDALAEVRAMAFDKTGTLTVGRPVLSRIALRSPVGGCVSTTVGADENAALRLIASAESRSEHPLAAALVKAAEERGLTLSQPTAFQSVPGRGVSATVDDVSVDIGRRSWIVERAGAPIPDDLLSAFDEMHVAGATPVFVAFDGEVVAALSVADRPRERVAEALREIRAAGVSHLAMLTGDDESTAQVIAAELGIDHVYAELLPEAKTQVIERIRREHGSTAMVGDGVNDAPALATADVGIALGAAGSDVALETADLVVMVEELGGIAHALRLSRRARVIVRQNLVFSVSVMVVLVALALTGTIGLTAGVIGHEGSTVIVVFNGLRLLSDGRTR